MKISAIVAARMSSQRLPGKVLRAVAGVPMLEQMMRRLSHCRQIHEIVIATSVNPSDDAICDFARSKSYLFVRGSEQDVLGRYCQAAMARKADVVVRLTGDCPLIDPGLTDEVVKRHIAKELDFTANTWKRTYPRGLDTEVLSMDCLQRLNNSVHDSIYREHVTNYIYDHPEKFKIQSVEAEKDFSRYRICVDTEEDFQLIEKVFAALMSDGLVFGWKKIVDLFERFPELPTINAGIEQAKIFKQKAIS